MNPLRTNPLRTWRYPHSYFPYFPPIARKKSRVGCPQFQENPIMFHIFHGYSSGYPLVSDKAMIHINYMFSNMWKPGTFLFHARRPGGSVRWGPPIFQHRFVGQHIGIFWWETSRGLVTFGWLVVGPPLWKNMFESIGMIIGNIWENKIDGNQTTNQ